MRVLQRLLAASFGLLLAIPAAGMFLPVVGLMDPAGRAFAFALVDRIATVIGNAADADVQPAVVAGQILFGLWRASLLVLAAPVLVAAIAGEMLHIRAYLWYAVRAGMLTASVPWLARGSARPSADWTAGEGRLTLVLFLTGAVAGTVYWLIAGRNASGPLPARFVPKA